MTVKSAALLFLLPLLQEVGADWTTTVHTTLIVPNTVTPVVKFVTPPATPLSSTPSSLPLEYDHASSHKLKLTSVVTVPDGHIPTVHLSTIAPSGKHTGTDGGSGGAGSPSATTSPEHAHSGTHSAATNEGESSAAKEVPGNSATTSADAPPGGHSSSKPRVPNESTTSGSHPKHTNTQPASPETTKSGSPAGASGGSSESGSPDEPHKSQPHNTGTKGSHTSSSKHEGPGKSNTSGTPPKHKSTQPASPETTKSGSPAGTSGGSSESGSSGEPHKSQPHNTGTKGSHTSSSKHFGSGESNTSGTPPKHKSTQPASTETTKSDSPAGTSDSSSKSGSPDEPASSQPHHTGTKGSGTTSSKHVGPDGSSTSNSPPKHKTTQPASPDTAKSDSPAVTSGVSSKSGSPDEPASTSHTHSGNPDQSTAGSHSSSSTVKPSDQVSSVDLSSASDIKSAAASNSDIAEFAPTASPSQEEWATMPATTTSGSPASTSSDSAIIAVMLKNSYNNIDDLKKDPKTYKKHIEDIDDHTSKYLSKTGFDTGKSPCSGSKKRSAIEKRGIFDAVANLAKSAVGATVDTASDIASSALSCVAPIVDDIKNVIPDDINVKDITPEIENQVKKGTEYLDEISNIVDDMEDKKKENENKSSSSKSESSTTTSSSKSESSTTTSSSTKTCTSSTTYSDCTWDTIVTPVADSDTTTISVITSTHSCTTRTGCDEKPTTFETTSTVGSCSRVYVKPAPGVGIKATSFGVSSTSGAGASGGSSATPHSTASPDSAPKTTGSSSSTTRSAATTTTSEAPKCSAHHVVDQVDGWEYCEFSCSEYTGRYSVVHATSGKPQQPCPYSRPPAGNSWSPDNEGPFTTTAKDGTVYKCDDSRYIDRNVADSKSCATSAESITRISSIYASYTSSVASASSASESSVSASKASASSASAASASASAAASSPDYVYIVFDMNLTPEGGFNWEVVTSTSGDDPDLCNDDIVGSTMDGTSKRFPGSIDIDNGDLDGCSFEDSGEIKCDGFTLPCKEFHKEQGCGMTSMSARAHCSKKFMQT